MQVVPLVRTPIPSVVCVVDQIDPHIPNRVTAHLLEHWHANEVGIIIIIIIIPTSL